MKKLSVIVDLGSQRSLVLQALALALTFQLCSTMSMALLGAVHVQLNEPVSSAKNNLEFIPCSEGCCRLI